MDCILYWNTRGACGKGLLRNLKLICSGPRPCVLILAETRTDMDSRFKCLSSMGYDSVRIIPSVGKSGGLAIAWVSSRAAVTVLQEDRQFFHLLCRIDQSSPFLLTAVYAIPHSNFREILWANIQRLSKQISSPWCVLGDFNDILNASERIGGRGGNFRRMLWFHEQISDCGLSYMGSSGPKMTWKGPCITGCARLYERLDRALSNSLLFDFFPDAYAKVLPRTKFSDHNPLLLCVGSKQGLGKAPKPFRFEAMWLAHESFSEFLKCSWSEQCNLPENLEEFKCNVGSWNREVFGFVERKKSDILARLNGMQKSPAYPRSKFLCDLELQLQSDLNEVLKAEEVKWFQKSKSIWISQGDRNTRYYHLKTTIRRRRNRVLALKDSNGHWVDREDEVKCMVIDFFKQLYQEDTSSEAQIQSVSNFPVLDEAVRNSLGIIPSNDEIKSSIFSMGPYKAPGVDGFSPIFYQAN
ncbi:hypothetical protein QN277_002786 [Acacia crassicarpa]|uniref:Endonuclease/exonuclease/phosphatase domain-containing protein n=1 Tax=Acacia crassicarpa TaxID=499986 RepID=A0AAE1NBL9_9FABA|nr:hypothetical protein QN277_002786 [Acacia crassicarpa]